MVCDMVEQPRRVAARMGEWFANGWCRQAIFNLKLPMKKRWLETTLCLDLLQQHAGQALTIRARQLYHDREEITVFAQNRDSGLGTGDSESRSKYAEARTGVRNDRKRVV